MRCKACNSELSDSEIFFRKMPDGSKELEDLCRRCRSAVFYSSDPDDFDLIDGLGIDIDNDVGERWDE